MILPPSFNWRCWRCRHDRFCVAVVADLFVNNGLMVADQTVWGFKM
jgi:hypothetical protein